MLWNIIHSPMDKLPKFAILHHLQTPNSNISNQPWDGKNTGSWAFPHHQKKSNGMKPATSTEKPAARPALFSEVCQWHCRQIPMGSRLLQWGNWEGHCQKFQEGSTTNRKKRRNAGLTCTSNAKKNYINICKSLCNSLRIYLWHYIRSAIFMHEWSAHHWPIEPDWTVVFQADRRGPTPSFMFFPCPCDPQKLPIHLPKPSISVGSNSGESHPRTTDVLKILESDYVRLGFWKAQVFHGFPQW